ncbi:hypothetical protein [Burkholderia cepacia]|uniref:hypothetical protein n=1 Tax=Burkholderia cepacia TaxID=292 RepID=UPI002AB786A6|nr:hypothetical protein [Burkholderia cepacia]
MDTQQARRIVSEIPEAHHETLRNAHLRYMHFTGVYSGDIPPDQIERDRASYPHLLKENTDGVPALSDKRCADFMAAITGLSREWCLAWDEVEFVEMHGEEFFETQFKLQESARLRAQMDSPE